MTPMQTELDNQDEPELITNPAIVRLREQLHDLTLELMDKTLFESERHQLDPVIYSLSVFRSILLFASDLTKLDAILHMSFPDKYYSSADDIKPMLTNFPLGGDN